MINTKFKQTEIGEILENWQSDKLSDIVDINPFRKLEKGKESKSVPMEFLSPFTRKVQSYVNKKYSGGTKFKNDDTLLARITPCLENGKTAFVDFLDENEIAFGSTEYIVLSEKIGKTIPKFVYYLSISPEFRKLAIKSMSGSSGRQRVQTNVLANTLISYPSIDEQKQIVSVLSSLDDKIELNIKSIKTLEEIGQTLFKRWFIDFDFPNEKGEPYKSSGGEMVDSELGETPKGWTKGILGDIAKINTKSIKPFNFHDDIFIHYSIPSFDDTHAPKLESGSDIKSNKTLVNENSLLVSKLNPLGWTRIWTVFYKKDVKQITSTEFINYIPKNEIYWSYLNFLFREKVYYLNFCSKTTGSTGSRQRVLPKSTLDTSITIPTVEVLENYSKILIPVLEQIEVIHNQIQELKNIRDSLLPKLLSGDIRV